MKYRLFAAAIAGIAVLPSLAQAMDCAKASSPLEHLICTDPQLVRADADMGKAYTALLKQAASDAQIHTMLVASQRRWVAARDNSFGDLSNSVNGQTGEGYSKAAQRKIVLQAIKARTAQLAEVTPGGTPQPQLIQAALAQRKAASAYTGGPFAGFSTSCDFLPHSGEYSYGCFATHFYQHHNRVCSVTQDWASGAVYETRAVANVVGGKAVLTATCKLGDSECSGADSQGSGWHTRPDELDADMQREYEPHGSQVLPAVDAEVHEEDQAAWLHSCLTDPHYPAVN